MDKNHHNAHPTPEGVPGRTPELPVEQVERLQALAGLLSELVHVNHFEAQQDGEGRFDLRAVRPNMQCRTKCYRLGVTFQQGSEWRPSSGAFELTELRYGRYPVRSLAVGVRAGEVIAQLDSDPRNPKDLIDVNLDLEDLDDIRGLFQEIGFLRDDDEDV